MTSAVRLVFTRSSEARKLRTPSAAGSFGSSGNTSNSFRPMMSERSVIVARKYASLTATIENSCGQHEVKSRGRLKEDAKRHGFVVLHRATHAFRKRGIGLVFTRHWPKMQRVSCELAHQFVSYGRKRENIDYVIAISDE